MLDTPRFQEYFEITKDEPPRPLVVKAVAMTHSRGDALDLGCGAGCDTRFLLAEGITVTAVDGSPLAEPYLRRLPQERLTFMQSLYGDFVFRTYDLISSQYALPFGDPETTPIVLTRILDALRPGGIFCGQLFGVRDSTNVPERNMTHHTSEQIDDWLRAMEVMELTEVEEDGQYANGTPKHWHYFDIIARKIAS